MTVAALRPAIIGLVLLAPAGIRPAAAEPDLCQADGSPFWLSRMGDRSNEAALPAPTQAGIDALRDRRATAISLQGLLGNKRVCPVSDFSALSRVVGLTAVDDLPTECLAAFARTARLPALRAIAVMCGDDTAIDLQKLLDYQALEAVRLVFGCRLGPTGQAGRPLGLLSRVRLFRRYMLTGRSNRCRIPQTRRWVLREANPHYPLARRGCIGKPLAVAAFA